MSKTPRGSHLSDSGSSSTTGGGSIRTGLSTGTTTYTPQPDSSFRLVLYEPPELMIDLETSRYQPRDELGPKRVRIEDSNATLTSTVRRFYEDIGMRELATSRYPNIQSSPLGIYLQPENFQIMQQIITYFNKEKEKSSDKWRTETHACTSFIFSDKSTNFEINTVKACPYYYVILKEEKLVSSLNSFFDVNSNRSNEVPLALLSIRSNLLNKYFVQLFIQERVYKKCLDYMKHYQLFVIISFVSRTINFFYCLYI